MSFLEDNIPRSGVKCTRTSYASDTHINLKVKEKAGSYLSRDIRFNKKIQHEVHERCVHDDSGDAHDMLCRELG